MCIEDIAIGRRSYTKVTMVGISETVKIPANPDRLSVRIGGRLGYAEQYGLALTESDAAAGVYIVGVRASDLISTDIFTYVDFSLNYRNDGPIVWQELWANSVVGNTVVVETIMSDDLANEIRQVLKAERDSFRRK